MAGKQQKPLTTLAIMLALASTGAEVAANSIARPVLAQSTTDTSFPIPKELPSGQSLQIDGSTSMSAINEALEKNFETKYPGTDVKISYQGTDAALQALREGKIDLAAIGRPLTKEEKEQGLVAVPVTRHKIAIIVGKDNLFNKSITAKQFAKIYRGEISDWSEVGGEPGKIRIVDRPDNSDTRQLFPTYSVFQEEGGFSLSSNNQKIAEDSTQAVIDNLGKDGISYAISDQVVNNPNARIVVMHNVLPDSPRYPFSQPLIYVYNKSKPNLTPVLLAFLGNVKTSQNQQLIEEARVSGVMAVIDGNAASTTPPAAVQPDSTSTPTAQPEATTGAVAAEEAKDGISPWLWLLLLPLLGGLLWWLFKGRGGGGAAPVIPPVVPTTTPKTQIILTPRSCRDAYASWEVPDRVKQEMRQQGGQKMKLRLYDVTDLDIDRQTPHSVKEFDCSEQQQDLHLPITVDDRDYIAELGYLTSDDRWLSVVRSTQIRVPACQPTDSTIPATAAVGAGAAALATQPTPVVDTSRLILEPRTAQDAYVYWEVPEERKAELQKLGGKKLALRVYDTTGDVDLDRQQAHSVQQYDCDEQNPNLQIQIPQTDRDYTAELGYIADDEQWLKIARSLPVRINSEVKDSNIPALATGGLGVAAAAVAGTALADPGIEKPTVITPASLDDRLILVPGDSLNAEAAWEISPEKHAEMQELGGQKLVLCLYDVTDGINLDRQPFDWVQEYDCDAQQSNLDITIPQTERDYIAEIGYMTDLGQWLQIARSSPVRMNSEVQDNEIPTDATGALLEVPATPAGVGLANTLIQEETPEIPTLDIQENRLNLVQKDSQNLEATWEIAPEKHTEIQQLGGEKLVLYLYDITGDIDLDLQPANSEQQYDCDEYKTELQIPIPQSDSLSQNQDYIAEIGYMTDFGQWLRIARSLPVQINSEVKDSNIPSVTTGALGTVAAAAVAAAAGLAGTVIEQQTAVTPSNKENRLILVPRNAQDAYAYWEISPEKQTEVAELGDEKFLLRLYDTTGGIDLDKQQAHCVREYECDNQNPDLHIATPQSDRDYTAELGYITKDGKWVKIVRSLPVTINSEAKDSGIPAATGVIGTVTAADAAVADAASTVKENLITTIPTGQVTLTVRNAKNADADWEILETEQAELQKAGKKLLLRVYDITGIDLNTQPTNCLEEYECDPGSTNVKIVIPQSDRDYIAELGYLEEGKWLTIARSASLRIISPPTKNLSSSSTSPSSFIGNAAPIGNDGVSNVAKVTTNVVADTSKTVTNLTGDLAKTVGAAVSTDAAAVAGLGTAANTALQTPQENTAVTGSLAMKPDCRIIITPYNAQDAYVFWEVSESYKVALRQQGGKKFMLRVHDATGLDIDYQQPHNTLEYLCEETQQDKHVTVPVSDRDYIAEVGYYTEDSRWLRLIRSFHIRVPLEGKSK